MTGSSHAGRADLLQSATMSLEPWHPSRCPEAEAITGEQPHRQPEQPAKLPSKSQQVTKRSLRHPRGGRATGVPMAIVEGVCSLVRPGRACLSGLARRTESLATRRSEEPVFRLLMLWLRKNSHRREEIPTARPSLVRVRVGRSGGSAAAADPSRRWSPHGCPVDDGTVVAPWKAMPGVNCAAPGRKTWQEAKSP